MRVLHFCSSFSRVSETFIYDYIIGLERLGIENYVVALDRQNALTRPFDKVRVVGRPSRWFSSQLWYRILAALGRYPAREITWPYVRKRLAAFVGEISPDVIHAHFGPQGVVALPVASQSSTPLVVSFHGFDLSKLPQSAFWRAHYDRLWKVAGEITVVAQRMKEAAVELGCPPSRLHVIRVGRDIQVKSERREQKQIRRFITVGRLVEKKGHLDAIRSFHRVLEKYPDLHLTIVGEGDWRPQIENLVRELRCDESVRLTGALPNDETLRLMAEADAFLLCSKTAQDGDQEGAPTVLLEAQLVGLPCVSTRHAGIPETIPPANHKFLATEGNIDEIAARLHLLMEADRADVDAIVQRGRAFVEEHFNLAAEVEKLRSIYSTALALRK